YFIYRVLVLLYTHATDVIHLFYSLHMPQNDGTQFLALQITHFFALQPIRKKGVKIDKLNAIGLMTKNKKVLLWNPIATVVSMNQLQMNVRDKLTACEVNVITIILKFNRTSRSFTQENIKFATQIRSKRTNWEMNASINFGPQILSGDLFYLGTYWDHL
ncbi:hypothetical protein ACJX0J_013550, partial [Zea mays]